MFWEKNNHKDLNDLPTEMKIQIIRGQTLVDQTRKIMKEKGIDVDLTCRLMLNDNCKEVERLIDRLKAGKTLKKPDDLSIAITKLQTTSENILQWEFNSVGG